MCSGVALTLLILLAGVASLRNSLEWVNGRGSFGFRVYWGGLMLRWVPSAPSVRWFNPNRAGWEHRQDPFVCWGLVAYHLLPHYTFQYGHCHVAVIPIWLLALLVAVPTVRLWRRDRRRRPGHCQRCSYDLTGNTSGICPECGAPAPHARHGAELGSPDSTPIG
jgi:hypothetical protein